MVSCEDLVLKIHILDPNNHIGGKGNGNPLQYSCLENPRDGGAWWAAIYGVAQGGTRLNRLSSSSSTLVTNGLNSEPKPQLVIFHSCNIVL